MKLATLKDSTRDGRLVVVSKDLTRCSEVGHIARTLQAALDDWAYVGPRLDRVAEGIETGSQPTMRFHEHDAASPLPRAFQWADGSAYVNHVELVRRARNAEMPESFWTDPLMYQGGSDSFIGPRDPILLTDEAWGCDMEGEVAVIVDEVPMGASRDEARAAIRLVMLVNDVSLRELIPAELAKGFGFFQSKPSSAFSPVAVSVDELGDAWDGGKLTLPLRVDLNGKPFGRASAGKDMTFDFPQLIVHAAKTRFQQA
jgi:fumarylacetoacetate (FAA) hydrolase